jgi:small subunit ribosomal protein S21
MIIIESIKEHGSMDRALKVLKKKFESTGTLQKLRDKKEFKKKSELRRAEVLNAKYRHQFNND